MNHFFASIKDIMYFFNYQVILNVLENENKLDFLTIIQALIHNIITSFNAIEPAQELF